MAGAAWRGSGAALAVPACRAVRHVKSIGVVGVSTRPGPSCRGILSRRSTATGALPRAGFPGMFHLGRLLLQRGQRDEAKFGWTACLRPPRPSCAKRMREMARRAASHRPGRVSGSVRRLCADASVSRGWAKGGHARCFVPAASSVPAAQVLSRASRTASSTTRARSAIARQPFQQQQAGAPALRRAGRERAQARRPLPRCCPTIPAPRHPAAHADRVVGSDRPRQRAGPNWRTRRRTGCWWPEPQEGHRPSFSCQASGWMISAASSRPSDRRR